MSESDAPQEIYEKTAFDEYADFLIKTDLEKVENIEIGSSVRVHVKIREGGKERVQVFSGIVIARSGSGTREMFAVRRIVQGEGVERKFPLHSPRIAKIEVKRSGVCRRAKLYFLRDRVGKSRRLRDQRRGLKHVN